MPLPLPALVSPPAKRTGILAILAAFFVAGCGVMALISQSGCSIGQSGSSASTEPAKATVSKFLEAIKRGDEVLASSMLTKLARAKTEELGISVAPPVQATAIYSIQDCEMVGEADDLVHVSTNWTDTDADGFTSTDSVVWVVRLDPEGWRVVGMAMRIFDDMAPLLLNFEDPEDMLAKQELVAEELHKRAEKDAQTAAKETKNPQTARSANAAQKVE